MQALNVFSKYIIIAFVICLNMLGLFGILLMHAKLVKLI